MVEMDFSWMDEEVFLFLEASFDRIVETQRETFILQSNHITKATKVLTFPLTVKDFCQVEENRFKSNAPKGVLLENKNSCVDSYSSTQQSIPTR